MHFSAKNFEFFREKIPIKDLASHSVFAAELIKIGGRNQVPCLIINGKALYESRQIIQWLQDNLDAY